MILAQALLAAALLLVAAPLSAGESLDLVAVAFEADRLGEVSFREMLARERRLLEVSTRVRRGSVGLCGDKVAPILGLQVMSLRDLPPAYMTPAIRGFNVTEAVSVVSVLPDSASARAGLRTGDVLVSVDDFALENTFGLNTRRAKTGAATLRFLVERAGKRSSVDVAYEAGCYSEPLLALSSSWNALAGGRRIVVYSELIREVKSDDELAVVVGHELAHIVLGHERSSPPAEADADYLGLYLAALGGFDVEAGAQIWNRFARSKPWTLVGSDSHPSAPVRAMALERAMREIRAKREAGAPLRPEGLD